jgi:hypothetical protein
VFHGTSFQHLLDCWRAAVATIAASGIGIHDGSAVAADGAAATTRNSGSTASIAASLVALKPCCVLPALGAISGGSLGVLQILEIFEPLRPLFITLACVLITVSFHRLFWRPVAISSELQERSVRRSRRLFYAAVTALIIAIVVPPLVIEFDAAPMGHEHHG